MAGINEDDCDPANDGEEDKENYPEIVGLHNLSTIMVEESPAYLSVSVGDEVSQKKIITMALVSIANGVLYAITIPIAGATI